MNLITPPGWDFVQFLACTAVVWLEWNILTWARAKFVK